MTPKLWMAASLVSLAAAIIIFAEYGQLPIPRMISMLFVFLTLWFVRQRRAARKMEESKALWTALDNEGSDR